MSAYQTGVAWQWLSTMVMACAAGPERTVDGASVTSGAAWAGTLNRSVMPSAAAAMPAFRNVRREASSLVCCILALPLDRRGHEQPRSSTAMVLAGPRQDRS